MTDAESTGNAAFIKAANDAKSLPTKPSDTDLLTMYGLFKQAVIGDNDTAKVISLDNISLECWISKAKPNGKRGLKIKECQRLMRKLNI